MELPSADLTERSLNRERGIPAPRQVLRIFNSTATATAKDVTPAACAGFVQLRRLDRSVDLGGLPKLGQIGLG
ncbi:hypothetical protein RKD18_008017 [Streptomyces phaeoluteigriseus]